MDPEFIKWLSTLGIGGILAGFMFFFYRKDISQFTDLWKTTSEQLMVIIKDNTASNVRLIALIETSERNTLRRADVEAILDKKLNERLRGQR